LIGKIQWLKLFKLLNTNSDDICVVWPSFPSKLVGYMTSGTFENDFALVAAMIKKGNAFRIVCGAKNVIEIRNKTIYHNISNQYGSSFTEEYFSSYFNWASKLSESNIMIPRLEDAKFWENKIFMHTRFVELNISHPATYVVDKEHQSPDSKKLNFPVLFKPAHSSGSIGIVKINNAAEYQEIIGNNTIEEFLIQEWIDMRSDLRLIYIGDELVLHYWRLNMGKEWKPTSTGHGSQVDFETLPKEWMDFLFKEYKKLNIKTGAFDVTWHKDDLTTMPKILEVSPSYMPNPKPVGKYLNRPYGEFKKAIWGTDAYYKKYIDLVFEFKIKLIDYYDKC